MWSKRRRIPKGLGKLKQDFENSACFSSFSSLCSLSLYTSCTPLKFHPVTKRISCNLQTVTSPKGPWACSPLVPSLTSDWLKWLCPPVGRYYLGKSWKLKTNALECIDDQALEAKRLKEPKEVEDLTEEIAIKQTVQISSSSHLPGAVHWTAARGIASSCLTASAYAFLVGQWTILLNVWDPPSWPHEGQSLSQPSLCR